MPRKLSQVYVDYGNHDVSTEQTLVDALRKRHVDAFRKQAKVHRDTAANHRVWDNRELYRYHLGAADALESAARAITEGSI